MLAIYDCSAKHRLEVYAKVPTTSEYTKEFSYKTEPLISLLYQYTF
ncbi:hypothetical protein [uncultured Helicobacter sp.]